MYARKRPVKLIALVLLLALLVGGAVGGTLAWLITNTDPVVNTFTVGNISITLTEGTPAAADRSNIKMVPGTKITKNPVVAVTDGSEDCWLFVEVTAANGVVLESATDKTGAYITYAIASGWEATNDANVYGRKVLANDTVKSFSVLNGDEVTVLDSVTKEMMDAITNGTASNPTLTFKAYAIQSANLKTVGENPTDVTTAAQAWAVYQAND